jgi:hypothetical protein
VLSVSLSRILSHQSVCFCARLQRGNVKELAQAMCFNTDPSRWPHGRHPHDDDDDPALDDSQDENVNDEDSDEASGEDRSDADADADVEEDMEEDVDSEDDDDETDDDSKVTLRTH